MPGFKMRAILAMPKPSRQVRAGVLWPCSGASRRAHIGDRREQKIVNYQTGRSRPPRPPRSSDSFVGIARSIQRMPYGYGHGMTLIFVLERYDAQGRPQTPMSLSMTGNASIRGVLLDGHLGSGEARRVDESDHSWLDELLREVLTDRIGNSRALLGTWR